MKPRPAIKCICGAQPLVRLSSSNEWYIICPLCGQVVIDGTDRRCKEVRVIEPRRELYNNWEARIKRLERERTK